MTRSNGVVYNATYDTSYRMTGQTDTDIAALRDIAYGYSLRDNLTSAGDLLDPGQNVTYSYDARQMLDGSTGPWGALGLTYDAVGNRATRSLTPPGGSASLDTYTYELTSNGLDNIDNLATGNRSYSYDAAGNTVGETRAFAATDDWTYVYNNAGRLASVSLNGVLQAEYVYNALGQQVGRTVGSGPSAVVTLSVHDLAGNRIAEHDDTGVVLREYIWLDGRPLAVVEGGQTYQLHWDQIGRPVMATDGAGAVVWAASYLPFGGIDLVWVDAGVLEQNLRFPGQWFQAETGLHQNWMRDYDPTTGRYLQADPLGLVDGPSVYGYARQSPVRFTDPTGEFIPLIPVLIAIAGGVGGYAVGELADYVEDQYCDCEALGGNSAVSAAAGASAADGLAAQYPKPRQAIKGSSKGSSIQSKGLSKMFHQRLPFRVHTPAVQFKPLKVRFPGTNVAGRAIGRSLPFVGAGIIGYDLYRIGRCLLRRGEHEPSQ